MGSIIFDKSSLAFKVYITMIWTLVLMFCVNTTFAQNTNLIFHELNDKTGLPPSEQYYMSTDSKGFLWIGSENGLLRYEGKQLLKFQHDTNDTLSLSENRITSKCYEDTNSNLWFSSFSGLNCYVRKTGTFLHFQLNQPIKAYSIIQKEGPVLYIQIGLGKQQALYSFDIQNSIFKRLEALPGGKCVLNIDSLGNLIQHISVSLPEEPGIQYNDHKNDETVYATFSENSLGVKKVFSTPTKTALFENHQQAWIGVYNSIVLYDLGANGGIMYQERVESIEKDIGYINAISSYTNDYLLIGADKGLFLFDKNTRIFVHQFKLSATIPHPFPLQGVNQITLDKVGNLWVSGNDNKIAYANIHNNRFTSIAHCEGISFVTIDEDAEGNIWCSSIDSGTYVFNAQKELIHHTTRLINPDFPNGSIPLTEIHYFIDQANTWWGNMGNYFFLWNENKMDFQLDFPYFLGVANTDFDRINYCYTLSNGKTLAARGKNIYELELNSTKVDTLPWIELDDFNMNVIQFIFEDQFGNIYINDDFGKLLIVNVNNQYLTVQQEIENFGIIHAIEEDNIRKKIWVAGSNGLGSFDGDAFTYSKYLSEENKTTYEVLYDLIIDKHGMIWVPSNNGLIRIDPETKNQINFNTIDGLSSSVLRKNTSLTSSKTGEIWIGGDNGINVFHPSSFQILKNQPLPILTNLLVNDEPYKIKGNLTELKTIELPYDQNTLSFQFGAIDYIDPSANEYIIQMEGMDDTPVHNSNRGFTRYGNIPAGAYTFKIWTTNADLILNETPLTIEIKINPPFYQTWWFYLLVMIAIISLIYGIFQYRIAQILKVERLRTRIASDLHDDVGGILSGLAMQTEILELTAKEGTKEQLKQISEMSRSAMSGMRDTVWAIDSRKDKFEDLLDRIREHAEEVLVPKDIAYEIQYNDIPLSLTLPPLIRQNLYLIFKEAITNISKHSNGNLVLIDLKMDKGVFELRVHDNGKVAEKGYKSSGLGLSNMKMRAKKLNGTLAIDNRAGYEVILQFPAIK